MAAALYVASAALLLILHIFELLDSRALGFIGIILINIIGLVDYFSESSKPREEKLSKFSKKYVTRFSFVAVLVMCGYLIFFGK